MNSLKTKISLAVTVISIFGLLTSIAAGQVQGPQQQIVDIPGTVPSPINTVGGLVDTIAFVVRWVYIVFFILAVLFILFAAFTYLTSGGGEGVEKAKNMIIYAAVAIAVALLAVGFQVIILRFLQQPTA